MLTEHNYISKSVIEALTDIILRDTKTSTAMQMLRLGIHDSTDHPAQYKNARKCYSR